MDELDSKWTGPGLYVPGLCVTNPDFVSPGVPFSVTSTGLLTYPHAAL